MHEAGFTSILTRRFDFPIPLPSFEAAWGLAASPGMFPVLNDNAEVREELREAIASYEEPGGGSYVFPVSCLLLSATRAAN
ncbi:hypothetical protein [Amycolatopsis sacchari]|uniref:hypothetical protein n=1 Tax=Amycolatopsis sacchari TaxID=115433 RepID=UPI003EBF45A8